MNMQVNHAELIPAHWYYLWQLFNVNIDPMLKSWLLEKGSITARCKRVCQSFQVKIVRQAWQKPTFSEVQALGIKLQTLTLVREIILLCDKQPWIFGRSIIPITTLRNSGRVLLSCLDNRPLGEFLFKNKLTRQEVQMTRLEQNHVEYEFVAKAIDIDKDPLWARRSIFLFHKQPLLVSETFLPTFKGDKSCV